MEDFGYQKYHETIKVARLIKRSLLTGAAISSIAIFAVITVKGYQMLQEPKSSDKVVTIKSPTGPIKIFAKEKSKKTGMKLDLAVYEDIFGNEKKKETIIVENPTPAIPPRIIFEQKKLDSTDEDLTKKQEKATPGKSQPILVSGNKKAQANQDLLSKSTDKSLLDKKEKETGNNYLKVQIAAMTSNSSARDYWHNLNKEYPSLFSNLKYYIIKADLGSRGVFYRLQIGNFKDREAAEKFCNRYIVKAVKTRSDCIVIKAE